MRAAVRRAWPLLAVVALAVIGATAVHKQVRDGNDFPIYWQAARALLAGRSPYATGTGLHGYVYLPWFAWALVPLALLPLPAAAWCWFVANVAFTWLAGRALLGSMRDAGVLAHPLALRSRRSRSWGSSTTTWSSGRRTCCCCCWWRSRCAGRRADSRSRTPRS